jgi:beta-phosphoglucomutase
VFDLDGVLVDSTAIHEQVWAEFLADRGLPTPAGGIRALFGRRGSETVAELVGLPPDSRAVERILHGLEDRVETLVAERHPDGLLVAGAEALVRELSGRLPIAVGTSARRRVAAARLGPLVGLFDTIVTAEDVTRGKPDPEVYLTAARRLSVDPRSCAVVEDAVTGVQAARAADAFVVGVRGTTSDAALRAAGADTIIGQLSELRDVLCIGDDDG